MAKKLKFAAIILAIFMLFTSAVFAEEAEQQPSIQNGSLEDWSLEYPKEWGFYSTSAEITFAEGEEGSGAQISLEEAGFAFLTQELHLQPQCTYEISCRVKAEGVTGTYPGVNINIDSQLAEVGDITETYGEWETLRMYVGTNVDETQDYVLRIGFGNEDNYVSGTVWIDNIEIRLLEEQPEDEPIYTLIGMLGSNSSQAPNAIINARREDLAYQSYSEANLSYNDIGTALFAVTFLICLYFFYTSRHAGRLGYYCNQKYFVALIFVAAAVLQLALAYRQGGHVTDFNCFKQWAMQLYEGGLSNFYSGGMFADYPPAYMYLLYLIGWLRTALGLAADSAMFGLLIKLPAIAADLILGYVVYRIAKRHLNQASGVLLSAFVLFSPAFLVTTCSWAQMDSLFILAEVGALYLLYRDKKIASAALWMVSFLIKPQALLLAPLFAIVFLGDLFRKQVWKKTLVQIGLSVLAMAAVYLILTLPMKGSQPLLYAVSRALITAGEYPYGSVNAANLMSLLGGNFVEDGAHVLFATYAGLGTVLIVLVILGVALLYYKKRDKKQIFLLAALMVAGIFVLGHQMHERYILPAIAFMLIAAAIANSRQLLISATAFSAAGFANIFMVLIFGADLPYPGLMVAFSAIMILSFAYFSWVAIRQIRKGTESKDEGILVVAEEKSSKAERKSEHAKERLEAPLKDPRTRMKKKDYLVCAIITVVYAAFAFTNLGSLMIPERTTPTDENQSIVLELDKPREVAQIKYYAGYSEGDFRVYYSDDGEQYFPMEEGLIEHPYRNMFKWKIDDIHITARYFKLVVVEGEVEFREIGLCGEDGKALPIVSARTGMNGQYQEASYLIDEQEQVPEVTTHLTNMYFDEVYHARTAYEYMEGIYPYEITHPPLGKSIITIGIQMFGFNPFGWRFMGTLFGVLQLPLLYVFCKRLFKRTLWAASATGLFAVDFMHFTLTRIATIDSYSIFFILLMFFFMYEYSQCNFNRQKLWKTFIPLGLCGIAFALGAATKWLCLYAGVGLCVLFFYTVYQRAQEYHYAKAQGIAEIADNYKKKLALTILFCVLVFIIIPVVVYGISYAPYQNATNGEFGIKGILENQEYMLNYHGKLVTESPHPYQSNVFSWPFDIRPVFFFLAEGQTSGLSGVIWCMGNPLVFWGALIGVIYLLGARRKIDLKGMPFVAIAALSGFVPWLLVSREIFIYHYFATLPFLIIALVYALRQIYREYKWGKYVVFAFLAACAIAFLLFYPAITGTVVARSWNKFLQWLPTWPV